MTGYYLYLIVQFVHMTNRKLLGSTKVSTDNKITIVKTAAEILGINRGDILAFYEEEGRVYIERG